MNIGSKERLGRKKMSNEKFYWLKLKRDFFKRHDMKIIKAMPNGKDYLIFYLELLCESVDHNGCLRFNDEIPYNDEMLATITDTNIDIVRSAIKLFTQLKMMEILDNGTYFMTTVNQMIGSAADNDNANRQRRYREKQKELGCVTQALQNVTESVTKNNESIEIDIDIDKKENNNNSIIITKEKDISFEKDTISKVRDITNDDKKIKLGAYQRISLKEADYQKLLNEYDNADLELMINALDEYVESNNNKNKYKNYYLVIKNAIRNNWFKINVREKQQASGGFAGFETADSIKLDDLFDTFVRFAKNVKNRGDSYSVWLEKIKTDYPDRVQEFISKVEG